MRSLVFLLTLFISFFKHAQIIQLENQQPVKKEARTSFLIKNSLQYCFRTIEENPFFVNSSIEEYQNEQAVHLYQFEMSISHPLSQVIFLETGLGFFQNGESFNFMDDQSDSTFAYSNRFQYFGLPLKLKFSIPIQSFNSGSFHFSFSAGFIPLLLNAYHQDRAWTSNFGSRNSEKFKDRTYINSYNIMGTLESSLNYNFNKDYAVHLIMNYNKSLINSYTKYGSHIRKAFSYGVALGLSKSF